MSWPSDRSARHCCRVVFSRSAFTATSPPLQRKRRQTHRGVPHRGGSVPGRGNLPSRRDQRAAHRSPDVSDHRLPAHRRQPPLRRLVSFQCWRHHAADGQPEEIQSVVLYGAGNSALGLINVIKRSPRLDVAGVVDPDPTLGVNTWAVPGRAARASCRRSSRSTVSRRCSWRCIRRRAKSASRSSISRGAEGRRARRAANRRLRHRADCRSPKLRRVQAVDLLGRAPSLPTPL